MTLNRRRTTYSLSLEEGLNFDFIREDVVCERVTVNPAPVPPPPPSVTTLP